MVGSSWVLDLSGSSWSTSQAPAPASPELQSVSCPASREGSLVSCSQARASSCRRRRRVREAVISDQECWTSNILRQETSRKERKKIIEEISKKINKPEGDLLKSVNSRVQPIVTKFENGKLQEDFSAEIINMMKLNPQPSWLFMSKQKEGSTEIHLRKR